MPRCVVPGCGMSPKNSEGLSFHEFPSDQATLEKWLSWTGRRNWCLERGERVCSRHFVDSDYTAAKRRRLKRDSVPSLCIDQSLAEQQKARRRCRMPPPATNDEEKAVPNGPTYPAASFLCTVYRCRPPTKYSDRSCPEDARKDVEKICVDTKRKCSTPCVTVFVLGGHASPAPAATVKSNTNEATINRVLPPTPTLEGPLLRCSSDRFSSNYSSRELPSAKRGESAELLVQTADAAVDVVPVRADVATQTLCCQGTRHIRYNC